MKYLFALLFSILIAGCSSSQDYNDPEVLVSAVSSECQAHAEIARSKGKRYFVEYSYCMQRTAAYLEKRNYR